MNFTILKGDESISPHKSKHAPWWEYPDKDFQTALQRFIGQKHTLESLRRELYAILPDDIGNEFFWVRIDRTIHIIGRSGKSYGKVLKLEFTDDGILKYAEVLGSVSASEIVWRPSSFGSRTFFSYVQ
jgi:hypothetical protein